MMVTAKKKPAVRKSTKKAVAKRKFYKAIGMDAVLDEPQLMEETKTPDGRVKVPDEVYHAVCLDIADGLSMRKACIKNDVSRNAFCERIRKDDVLHDHYMRAREFAGDACLDKIDEFEEMLKTGQIDSSSANVLIQTEKWKAQKYYPKMYGDTLRTQMIDDQGNGINPFDAFYKAVCDKKDYTR